MNIAGGARRIQFAGRCLIGISLVLFGACVVTLLVALLLPSLGLHVALAELVMIPLLPAVPGAALWVTGWVVEGFADNGAPPDRVRT
jgi:hypothetical protein